MMFVFLAEGFEEIEAISAVDVLRRAGLPVTTVGIGGEYVTGSHGVTVKADILPDGVDISKALAVVLPGGMPGTLNLDASPEVQSAIDYCAGHGILIAAICAAPTILARKGLLEGKPATVSPGFKAQMPGAELSGNPVVEAGNFITAIGAGVTIEFALRIVTRLLGGDIAEKLRRELRCR